MSDRESITLNDYQWQFIDTLARYPALIAGVGTGKSMCGLLRMQRLMELYPGNLGLVVRQNHTDLVDSTMKDYERYTGMKIIGDREAVMENGSSIIFRHGKEINTSSITNINLGAFFIEQGEEYENDSVFEMLVHRLRKKEVPYRSGFVIGNAKGRNWMWKKWVKDPPSSEFKVWLASTFDNLHNLPEDFVKDLEDQKARNPEFYKRFVENSFDDMEEGMRVIPYKLITDCQGLEFFDSKSIRTIGFDPSLGGDEAVVYCLEDGYPVERHVFHERDPMILTGHVRAIDSDFRACKIGIDYSGGLGEAIGSRLREMYDSPHDSKVIVLNSSTSLDSQAYFNLRTEMWWNLRTLLQHKQIRFTKLDDDLVNELTNVKFKIVDSRNKVKLELKDVTKKRIGKSPDKADAFIYGMWAYKLACSEYSKKTKAIERYKPETEKMYECNRRRTLRMECTV